MRAWGSGTSGRGRTCRVLEWDLGALGPPRAARGDEARERGGGRRRGEGEEGDGERNSASPSLAWSSRWVRVRACHTRLQGALTTHKRVGRERRRRAKWIASRLARSLVVLAPRTARLARQARHGQHGPRRRAATVCSRPRRPWSVPLSLPPPHSTPSSPARSSRSPSVHLRNSSRRPLQGRQPRRNAPPARQRHRGEHGRPQ